MPIHAWICSPAHDVRAVPAEHAFRRAGRAAAHQQDRRIVGREAARRDRLSPRCAAQQPREIVIAGRERDAIAVALSRARA